MAKKQLTVEEYKAKAEKKAEKAKKFSKVFLGSIAVLLSLVIVFSVVSISFTYMGSIGSAPANSGTVNNNNNSSNGDDVIIDNNDGTTDETPSGDADAPAGDDTTPSDDATTPGDNNSDTPNAGPANANQEYLDMYKKAVAAARTKSKSVIRVKDGAINYKGIVEAGGLSSAASTLMGMFMAKDEASIKAKNEAWDKSKLPNANALTLNGLQKISRVEKGNTYVITVVAKNAVNPKANADGVGAIAGVIEESQITGSISSVPGLSLNNIKVSYENVTAVATIDKATGNLIALNLNAPCILSLDAKLGFIAVNNAKVGIQVITEYKISY